MRQLWSRSIIDSLIFAFECHSWHTNLLLFWSAITHMQHPDFQLRNWNQVMFTQRSHRVGLSNTNAHIWISWSHTCTTLTSCLMTQPGKEASSNTPKIVLAEMACIVTCPHSNSDLLFGKKLLSVWSGTWQISLYASFWQALQSLNTYNLSMIVFETFNPNKNKALWSSWSKPSQLYSKWNPSTHMTVEACSSWGCRMKTYEIVSAINRQRINLYDIGIETIWYEICTWSGFPPAPSVASM